MTTNQQTTISECIDFLLQHKSALQELPNLLTDTEAQRAYCQEAKQELLRAQEVFETSLARLKELEEQVASIVKDEDRVTQLLELATSLQSLLTLSTAYGAQENVGFE